MFAVSATMVMAAAVLARAWSGPPGPDFALWILLGVLGEALWLRLPVGNATLSMAITANFAAMLVLPTGHALAAIAMSTVIAEATMMRKSPLRLAFNASQSILAAAAGVAVMEVLGGGALTARPFGSVDALACLAGAAAYTLVNTGMVSMMIGLEHRLSPFYAWRVNFANTHEVMSNGALFSMGAMLALLIGQIGSVAVLLIALPVVLAWLGYRRPMRPPAAEFYEENDLDAA